MWIELKIFQWYNLPLNTVQLNDNCSRVITILSRNISDVPSRFGISYERIQLLAGRGSLVRCESSLRRHWTGPEASPLHASENITGRDNRRIHLHSREILGPGVFVDAHLFFFPLASFSWPLSFFFLTSSARYFHVAGNRRLSPSLVTKFQASLEFLRTGPTPDRGPVHRRIN